MTRFAASVALATLTFAVPAVAATPPLLLRAIAAGAHPYALFELDRSTYLLGVGDRIGSRTIRKIDLHGVRLSDGTQLHVTSDPGPAANGDVTLVAAPQRSATLRRPEFHASDDLDRDLVAEPNDDKRDPGPAANGCDAPVVPYYGYGAYPGYGACRTPGFATPGIPYGAYSYGCGVPAYGGHHRRARPDDRGGNLRYPLPHAGANPRHR